MNGERLEAVLARLYTDEAYRAAFLANPREAARAEGLSEADGEGLAAIDKDGLELAADSHARKRRAKGSVKGPVPPAGKALPGMRALRALVSRLRRLVPG